MNPTLKSLTGVAVVGTSRQALRLPEWPATTGATLAAIAGSAATPELQLLRLAGAAAFLGATGFIPGVLPEPVPAADAETQAEAGDALAVSVIADILVNGPERLQHLACNTVAQQQLLLPPLLLPCALELGRRLARLREPLRPLLGRRGAWLGAQNPDWRWALALPDAAEAFDWEAAPQEQRLAWLERTLPQRPQEARQRLQDGFTALPARERLQLLDLLRAHVNPEDEAFLQGLLADRSKEVRQLAAGLLSALPHSAFAQQVGAWLTPCLKKQRKLLRETLEFQPPETFDPDWKKATLEEDKPQHEKLGPRAWWALQLARLAPLGWWTSTSGLAPLALLEWAKAGDWAEPLLRGWLAALDCQPNPDWADAWLRFTPPKNLHIEPYRLLPLLPLTLREQHWRELLRSLKKGQGLGTLLRQMLAGLPAGTLLGDAELARDLLDALRQSTLEKDYELRNCLPELACILSDALIADAADPALHETLARCASNDSAARFARLVEHRLTLQRPLAGPLQDATS